MRIHENNIKYYRSNIIFWSKWWRSGFFFWIWKIVWIQVNDVTVLPLEKFDSLWKKNIFTLLTVIWDMTVDCEQMPCK